MKLEVQMSFQGFHTGLILRHLSDLITVAYIEIITWVFRYYLIYRPEIPISDRGLARGPILVEG